MAYKIQKDSNKNGEIIIDGFQSGIAPSPYSGTGNLRNLNTSYYPGVAYVNYRRRQATTGGNFFFAGSNSVDEGGNQGWLFEGVTSDLMSNPVDKATSPAGINYILDENGQIFKQTAVNSSTFNLLGSGTGRFGEGNKGLAYWNNYLVVFGDGIIEFCGDGSGDDAIISTNWNLNYSEVESKVSDVFITLFGSSPASVFLTSTGVGRRFPLLHNGDSITVSSTGTLPAPLVAGTTYYIGVESATDSTVIFAYRREDITQYLTVGPSSGATSATLSVNYTGVTGSYAVSFSTGDQKVVTITNGSNSLSWSGGLSGDASNVISISVAFTSDGTGVHTFTDTQHLTPLGNCTDVTIALPVGSYPYTSGTFAQSGFIGSYVNPVGETVSGMWKEATGVYNIVLFNGQKIPALFTNSEPDFTYQSVLSSYQDSASLSGGTPARIEFINEDVENYTPYVSKVDDNLYFANGNELGVLIIAPSTNLNFNPQLSQSYSVNFSITSLPGTNDTITDMVDLKATMVVSGKYDVYSWDYLSASVSSPSPVGELIHKITNVLNNIYVFAGNKGNVYISNGYSAQAFKKIPDFIAGVIDPVWEFGDQMTHRTKLWFQALAKTNTGTNILAGIFSIDVNSDNEIVMESQNSYGLTPASGASHKGVLIDNQQFADNDSYYSAWSNGDNVGGIDYNDTSVWQNFEPVLETEIIPIGNILDKQTLGNIQFKLDRPMVAGDEIRMYWRPSLTASYTLMGTTTTTQLSDYYPSNVSQAQWAQFKVEYKGASSNSSFLPLKEVRLHFH